MKYMILSYRQDGSDRHGDYRTSSCLDLRYDYTNRHDAVDFLAKILLEEKIEKTSRDYYCERENKVFVNGYEAGEFVNEDPEEIWDQEDKIQTPAVLEARLVVSEAKKKALDLISEHEKMMAIEAAKRKERDDKINRERELKLLQSLQEKYSLEEKTDKNDQSGKS